MPNGIVKFFNAAKGFGFITPDGGGKDVFVPAATITTAGIVGLKTGQRVSFDEQPDGKGPKAVNLKLLAEPARAPVAAAAAAAPRSGSQFTLYCDPSGDDAVTVLAELRTAGHDPRVVDYVATPPAADQLKKLSLLLHGSNESLVRKYDHLFQALHLDDRFISENEFWGAVVEHPSLINGPLIATATQAAVCKSREAVKAFLSAGTARATKPVAKHKGLSPRLLKLMGGGVIENEPEIAEPVKKIVKKAKPVAETPVAETPAAEKPVVAKPARKAAKPKPAPKAKKTVKKAAAKPAKKTKRV